MNANKWTGILKYVCFALVFFLGGGGLIRGESIPLMCMVPIFNKYSNFPLKLNISTTTTC